MIEDCACTQRPRTCCPCNHRETGFDCLFMRGKTRQWDSGSLSDSWRRLSSDILFGNVKKRDPFCRSFTGTCSVRSRKGCGKTDAIANDGANLLKRCCLENESTRDRITQRDTHHHDDAGASSHRASTLRATSHLGSLGSTQDARSARSRACRRKCFGYRM